MTAELRQAIVETCRAMTDRGLNHGRAGNVSVRLDDQRFLITPSGVAYDVMQPDDLAVMTVDRTWTGRLPPSSEWRIHRDVYAARPDIGAIVHTHSTSATAVACLRQDLPAFHYMVSRAGGDSIRCAPYATFGSQELSDHAVAALVARAACLLANHGLIATGATLATALELAALVEELATVYLRARSAGAPVCLDSAEMMRVVDKWQTYGDADSIDSDLKRT